MSLHEITKIAAERTLLAAASCPRDISGIGEKEKLKGGWVYGNVTGDNNWGQQRRDDCNAQAALK